MAYLGGYLPEPAITPGKRYDVRFLDDRLAVFACRRADVLVEVPYGQVEHVEIGGPGLISRGEITSGTTLAALLYTMTQG